MTLIDLMVKLRGISDEDLRKELKRRHRKRLGPVLGYKAYLNGDDYNYGTTGSYMIGDRMGFSKNSKRLDKATAKARAESLVAGHHWGGSVTEIYKHHLKE